MNKSLVPLIISFAIIILLTFVVIYSRHDRPISLDEDEKEEHNGVMFLKPFPTHKMSFANKPDADSERQMPQKKYIPETTKLLMKAKALLAQDKEKEAEEELKTLLVFEPENKEALSLLGGIFYYSARYPQSELIFRKLVKIDPTNPEFHNQLGSTLAKQNKISEAISCCLKALDIEPNSTNARINLAGMYAISDDPENANKHLLAAYKLIGDKILTFALDSSFDKIRKTAEFQEIMEMARRDRMLKVSLPENNSDSGKNP